jgi:hypothetical protein
MSNGNNSTQIASRVHARLATLSLPSDLRPMDGPPCSRTHNNCAGKDQFHIKAVHNRMPVILPPKDYDEWLDRLEVERPPVHLLRPF